MGRSAAETQPLAQDHLLYEIKMVAGLAWRMTRHQALFGRLKGAAMTRLHEEVFDLAGRNADIEAFGLHVRVLVDFFFGKRMRTTDAVAGDFFDDPAEWTRVCGTIPGVLAPVKDRVGMEMAHLSYKRPAPSIAWDYEPIWEALTEVIRAFIDNVRTESLGHGFISEVREILDGPLSETVATRHHAELWAQATQWTPAESPPPDTHSGGTATSVPANVPQPYDAP